MDKIVAVGGGALGFGPVRPEVTPISREIVRLSGKKNPRLLFIPTASSDDRAYARAAQAHFAGLGCRVEVLYLHKENPGFKALRSRILAADILYVGGGNTLMMMNRWKRLGVDRALREARKRGKVLCGSSAGALCWFRLGNSDSRKYHDPRAPLIKVAGLGFIPALGCPHYNKEKDRRPQLKAMMKKTPGVALAMDNCAALEVLGDKARAIASKPGAGAYKVYWSAGKYHEEKLPLGVWRPLSRLASKPKA